jgi:hypothetical protein
MLKAYFDDSRMGQPPCYVLGGWVAPAEVWAPFSHAWRDILWMSPRIEYFKFEEAVNFKGQFHGLSREARDEKLRLLVSLIAEYKLLGAASVISHDLFQKYFGSHSDPAINDSYAPSLLGIVAAVIRHYKAQEISETIEFFFDYQPGRMAAAEMGWSHFVAVLPPEYREMVTRHPPSFLDDSDVLPLQAADLCAGRVREQHEARLLGQTHPLPLWGGKGAEIQCLQHLWNEEIARQHYTRMFGHPPISYTFQHGCRA